MRLRQIALVAEKLDPIVDQLTDVLGIEVAFNDSGVGAYGLVNAVMPIGDTFLEVVSPVEEETTAGRYLNRRGGDGGYMAIFQVDDLDAEQARLEGLGIRIVATVGRGTGRGIHLHPRDVGGAIVSLDQMDPPESWEWAGPGWESNVQTNVSKCITGVGVQSEDPRALGERWAQVLDRKLEEDREGLVIHMDDDGEVRFVEATDRRGDGIGGFTVDAADRMHILARGSERALDSSRESLVICGTRIYF